MQLVMSYKYIRHIKKLYSILMLVKLQVGKYFKLEINSNFKKKL